MKHQHSVTKRWNQDIFSITLDIPTGRTWGAIPPLIVELIHYFMNTSCPRVPITSDLIKQSFSSLFDSAHSRRLTRITMPAIPGQLILGPSHQCSNVTSIIITSPFWPSQIECILFFKKINKYMEHSAPEYWSLETPAMLITLCVELSCGYSGWLPIRCSERVTEKIWFP